MAVITNANKSLPLVMAPIGSNFRILFDQLRPSHFVTFHKPPTQQLNKECLCKHPKLTKKKWTMGRMLFINANMNI
ncbi:hypothetical protein RDWZM_007143 [Blomia tropicalis]|uniref:Uncharacterized protein n=1 Tax=Blomia tropicalis TaxID=40697 RepID=A0A9Q0RP30_BLOTA|nr:hypothetical protein RDWZM_007143 [Blomia tropicalis]